MHEVLVQISCEAQRQEVLFFLSSEDFYFRSHCLWFRITKACSKPGLKSICLLVIYVCIQNIDAQSQLPRYNKKSCCEEDKPWQSNELNKIPPPWRKMRAQARSRFKYLGRATASQHLECSYPAAPSTCLFGSTISFCIIPFDSLEFYYLDHVTNSCVRPRPARGRPGISGGLYSLLHRTFVR